MAADLIPMCQRKGVFAPDMPLICERFRLVEVLRVTDDER